MGQSATYLDHFMSPRNVGDADPVDRIADVEHQGGGCHDRLRITITLDGDRVKDAKFRARACSGTIPASSAATEWAKGKTLAQLRATTPEDLIAFLGGIPDKKRHSVELAARALREAGAE